MSKPYIPLPRSSFGIFEQAIGTELTQVIHSWIADITAPSTSPDPVDVQPDPPR